MAISQIEKFMSLTYITLAVTKIQLLGFPYIQWRDLEDDLYYLEISLVYHLMHPID